LYTVARDRKKWRRTMLEAKVHNGLHVVHEKKKKSCILSYNSCSNEKFHVKISKTFCSPLIPRIHRRCGTQRECGIDFIGLSCRLLQCFPQGRVRRLSLSVEHNTVHLVAIKQAIHFFPFACVFLFFILFIPAVLCFFLPTCLSWLFPSCLRNPLIVCFHKARPWLLPSTHSFCYSRLRSREKLL
jgi:hypothetical protein